MPQLINYLTQPRIHLLLILIKFVETNNKLKKKNCLVGANNKLVEANNELFVLKPNTSTKNLLNNFKNPKNLIFFHEIHRSKSATQRTVQCLQNKFLNLLLNLKKKI